MLSAGQATLARPVYQQGQPPGFSATFSPGALDVNGVPLQGARIEFSDRAWFYDSTAGTLRLLSPADAKSFKGYGRR
jgi:hypothetical protein